MKHLPFLNKFIVSIFLFISFPTSEQAADERNRKCGSGYKCGNIQGIGYPFWGDNRPQFCGHEDFELRCESNLYPDININNLSFIVLNINQLSQSMTIARLYLKDDACPEKLIKTTSNHSSFYFPVTDESTDLYYWCPFLSDSGQFNFTCDMLPLTGDPAAYYTQESSVQSERLRVMSLLKIAMPVHKAIVGDLFVWKNATVQEALKKGFDIGYDYSNRNSYTICESSGGICGSDSNTAQFRCLCSDKPLLACEISGMSFLLLQS